MAYEKFTPLNASSKFAICGIPIRVDTYKTCSFGCEYCFSNCRKIMEFRKELKIADTKWLEKKLDKIFNRGATQDNLLETLVADRYTWHCGGMSDPFQPIENELHVTKELVDITNKYDIDILFSTKSDNLYGVDVRPNRHSFQLSVTNVDNRTDIEPNVPSIENRYKLYKELKREGFKVGIRIQPFIPNVTSTEILDLFRDADHFTIEGLKLVPQNKEHKEKLLAITGLNKDSFTQMGLLNLKPEIRTRLYKPFIDKLEEMGASYSIADNDMHHLGNNYCCCGDKLVHKSTTINNTFLCQFYGEYCKEQLDEELFESGLRDCKCNHLFTSNRQEGCISVQEFFDKRFYRKTSPFSPEFLYKPTGQMTINEI